LSASDRRQRHTALLRTVPDVADRAAEVARRSTAGLHAHADQTDWSNS